MLNSTSPDVAVVSLSGEPTCSVDCESLARLIAAASATLDSDRTIAKAFIQQAAELLAYKKGNFSKPDDRVPLLIGAANLEDYPEEGVSFPIGLNNRRQAKMEARERQWRYRTTLAHANRIATLGQMSASIVHEIKQPVAAAVTSAQAALRFLERPRPNLEEVRQALTRIAQLGNRVVEVVERTRALVQGVPPRKDDFEINEAIREIISLSQEELVKNAVSVHVRFAQGLPLLRADRVQLQQVVLNLITNAVEAMSGVPEGTTRELRISTGQTNSGDILVAVQDSGPGLGAQNPDRVFDAFYSTKPRGLGIGLSICRSIIEAHEGRLWASPSEPRGATFQFTLAVHSDGASPEWDGTDA
jgi:C4-dicarboxylate-specific signal transduction histidine kinase